ncbi:MAG: exodeoxyribonuclease VII large subunit, partial [Verrucomicrobiota bacterium]
SDSTNPMEVETQTVTELTRRIRNLLEFKIGEVRVEGEVSNHKKLGSGHQYFTLKDSGAQLSCAFYRGNARFNKVRLKDGMQVLLSGDLSVYEARGTYQLSVRRVERRGRGDLHEKFEALKEKLRKEGLFDESRKQPIPRFPVRLGLITSKTGAVLQDMLTILKRRAPWAEIAVYPVQVQGEGAHHGIIRALLRLNTWKQSGLPRVDTLVVARGGGSLEDIWPFNEEALARAIAASSIPVISAVGHQTDFTIADFVADLRAPTPSAAAELMVPDTAQLKIALAERRLVLEQKCRHRIQHLEERLGWLARSGGFREPDRRFQSAWQNLDLLRERLDRAVDLSARQHRLQLAGQKLQNRAPSARLDQQTKRLQDLKTRLARLPHRRLHALSETLRLTGDRLQTLGPGATLARGYAIVLDKRGKPVRSHRAIQSGDPLTLRFSDGERGAHAD